MTPEALLWVWDQASTPLGTGASVTRRALTMLWAAYPEIAPEELESWPLGERDRHLLALREGLFGTSLSTFDPCPACGEKSEFSVSTADLAALPASSEGDHAVEIGDLTLRFRLPNSRDLLAAEAASEATEAEDILLHRCLLSAQRKTKSGRPKAIEPAALRLSSEEKESLAQRLNELDPLAEVLLDLQCASCGHRWQRLLEVAEILHREMLLLAARLLAEVARLARGYGWTEREVLSLSPARRRAYLELLPS